MVFVRRHVNTHAGLLLSFVAVFGKLGEKHAGTARCMLLSLLDSEAIGLFTLLDDAVVGGEDIGPIRSDDPVDLRRDDIPEHTAFQSPAPMDRPRHTFGMNLGRLSGSGDTPAHSNGV